MENILVSACLLGQNCKYNGGNNYCAKIDKLREKFNLIPICPETFGGLKSPRNPAEISGERVLLKDGKDVTYEFNLGADISLGKAKLHNCKYAILKERSPSCGVNYIYNGMFNGSVVSGQGVTAKLLINNGIMAFSEDQIDDLLSVIKDK